jgi:hypothetical protein
MLTIKAETFRELIKAYRLLLKPTKHAPRPPSASERCIDTEPVLVEQVSKRGTHTKPSLVRQVESSAAFAIARIHTKTNSNRLTRTLNHIGRAQKTGMFTEKVTFFCTALEALFSTSPMEVTHQVAERAAVVRAGSKGDRIDTYRFVKNCYSFRSKYIHGAPLKAEDELKLQGMCCELDTAVRECFHNVLKDECLLRAITAGGEQKLDEIMLEKLFE